jgi:CRP-like cAMP-binding protein
VITNDGIKNNRHAGDFFGEGALLHPLGSRSSTIKCKTPVHVIEIDREYFEKYMASSNGLVLSLREKVKIRRRNRAKALLKLQSGMKAEKFKEGDTLYKEGDPGDSLYIVEEGKVDVTTSGHRVIVVTPGNICGEHSLLSGRPRNTTAKCIDPSGCTVLRLPGRDFRKLMDVQPRLKESLVDMMNRRDFKKAVVLRL